MPLIKIYIKSLSYYYIVLLLYNILYIHIQSIRQDSNHNSQIGRWD